MRSFPLGTVALASGLAFYLPTTAAQAQIQLPGISVQGATLAAPAKGAPDALVAEDAKDADTGGVPATSVGNAVTVITRADLERQQVRQVADALRGLPGIAVGRSGAYGNLTQVRIRGAEGNHTLVLIDGVEANNTTDGEFDFSNLAAEDIERIEVIRGGMSALYGSGAVGGVINITTRRGQGPLALTLKTEMGSFATNDVAIRLAAGGPWANFALSANWRNTDGFNIAPLGDEIDGMNLRTFNFSGGVKLLEGLRLDLTLRHVDKTADRDAFGDFFAPVGSPQTAVDDLSHLRDKQFLAGAVLRWDTLNDQLTHQLHFKYNSTTTSDTDLLFPAFPFFTSNISERTTFGYLGTYRFDTPAFWGAKHVVSGLIEKEEESFVAKGDSVPDETHPRERLALAGEWQMAFANQVFVTAGLRHDDNSVFEDFTTWRLAAAWALKPLGLRPHASAGTAVKFPTMFEQFGKAPGFTPNPGLKPEESIGWDAGVEVTLTPAAALDVTYFHSELTNKIVATFTDVNNVPGVGTRDGIEFELRTKLTSNLSGIFAYTYLLAEDANEIQEIRRPRHAGRADLAYVFAGGLGTANLGVIYNGSITDFLFLNGICCPPPGRIGVDQYWVVNAAVSYKLDRGVELFGRVENLLDERYQEVFGYQAAPIAAFAGIKLTFGGPGGITWAGGQ